MDSRQDGGEYETTGKMNIENLETREGETGNYDDPRDGVRDTTKENILTYRSEDHVHDVPPETFRDPQ